MTKYKYWLIAPIAMMTFNIVLALVNANDIKVMQAEMNAPKRVEFTANGAVHSWPVDHVNTKIVSAE